MKLTVTRKSHTRNEKGKDVTYQVGDTFNGTERELKAFGDRLSGEGVEKPTRSRRRRATKQESDNGEADS